MYSLLCKKWRATEAAHSNDHWYGTEEDYHKTIKTYEYVVKQLNVNWIQVLKVMSEKDIDRMVDRMMTAVNYGIIQGFPPEPPSDDTSDDSSQEANSEEQKPDAVQKSVTRQPISQSASSQPMSRKSVRRQPISRQAIRRQAFNEQVIGGPSPRIRPTRGQPMSAHQRTVASKMAYPSGAQERDQSPGVSVSDKVSNFGLNGKVAAGLALLGMACYSLSLIRLVD